LLASPSLPPTQQLTAALQGSSGGEGLQSAQRTEAGTAAAGWGWGGGRREALQGGQQGSIWGFDAAAGSLIRPRQRSMWQRFDTSIRGFRFVDVSITFFQPLIIDQTTAMVGGFFSCNRGYFLQPGLLYVSCTRYHIGPGTLPLWHPGIRELGLHFLFHLRDIFFLTVAFTCLPLFSLYRSKN
jgi:hypothetical protein